MRLGDFNVCYGMPLDKLRLRGSGLPGAKS
jgi:hypothetical protein